MSYFLRLLSEISIKIKHLKYSPSTAPVVPPRRQLLAEYQPVTDSCPPRPDPCPNLPTLEREHCEPTKAVGQTRNPRLHEVTATSSPVLPLRAAVKVVARRQLIHPPATPPLQQNFDTVCLHLKSSFLCSPFSKHHVYSKYLLILLKSL